ncbi:FadR/GntR family transcriptional regulator [Streptomyces sp. NPDC093586]|uniref:FadR/GntR family transcriptional regulator n=1 Tax=Streptomyces sp. NPDC093586 TaxID=3366042 RepID=UPI00380B4A08
MALDTLRPNSLVDQAAQRLGAEITSGEWPVGAKLPGEVALAKSLGVGRSTVREAIRSLASAGLVQSRQGAGVFVIASTPQEGWPAQLRTAEITEIYEVRAMLEIQAAQLAAERRDKEDIAALDQAMKQRSEAAAGSDADFVDADIHLHATIVAAAHNRLLTGLFAEFVPALRRGLIDLLRLTGARSDQANHGEEAHAALVDAIRRGEADTAGRLLRAELDQTLALLRDI